MMGTHDEQKELFSYQIDLDKRIRKEHPLRLIKENMDFSWVRDEVSVFYGHNGNVSIDPVVIVKLLFLLFWDNVKSERELMRIIPERLDYLWFLGYGLDDEIPDHSVLSKARNRWGRDVFELLFIKSVQLCVEAGLVEGKVIHADGSIINADASQDSVVRGGAELISRLKSAYEVQDHKLESQQEYRCYKRENKKLMSTTDPDAPVVRHSKQGSDGISRSRYKHHRCVDNLKGVITGQVTTPGDVEENAKLIDLIEQHKENTGSSVEIVAADKQYGTVDNFRRLKKRGITTHMDRASHGNRKSREGMMSLSEFKYSKDNDIYTCPAGKILNRRRHDPIRQATEYKARKNDCLNCSLKDQCTRSKHGRTIMRHDCQELVDEGKIDSSSYAARRNRRRRRVLIEGSFGQAATNHHFKRSRWRRLWRQQIQDDLIAIVQNLKIIIQNKRNPPLSSGIAAISAVINEIMPNRAPVFNGVR